MNRKSYRSFPALIVSILVFSALAFLTSCGSSSSTPPAKVVTIAATNGGGQSAVVGMAFANPLAATVTTNGTPASGVTVTFTAPAAEPNGTFAGAVATATATTGSNGLATSPAFTAGTMVGTYSVTASAAGATPNASFSLTNTAGAPANLAATSGTPQSAGCGRNICGAGSERHGWWRQPGAGHFGVVYGSGDRGQRHFHQHCHEH